MAWAEKFDLVVIGCGPAGEKGAAQVAYFGKKVAIIERATQVGGAGINTGTVPSKTLCESALYFSGLKQRGLYGIDYSLHENLKVGDFMHHLEQVVEMERRKILKNLEAHKIELIQGQATFEDSHTVSVAMPGGRRRALEADTILIATGSKPNRTPDIPFDDLTIFDSGSILRMDRIPESLIVVGGGVIGSEYASIFLALGVKVILTDGRDTVLTFLDRELSDTLCQRFAEWGMELRFKDRMEKIERGNAGRSGFRPGTLLRAKPGRRRAQERGMHFLPHFGRCAHHACQCPAVHRLHRLPRRRCRPQRVHGRKSRFD